MGLLDEKPNVLFFYIYRNYVERSREFERLQVHEKLQEIRRAKNRLTVLENDVINEIEALQRRL
jgi:flagellar motility protein MotE (MotC chaperone)